MLALFFSIVTVTASVVFGALIFRVPQYLYTPHSEVLSASIPSPTPSLTELSPTLSIDPTQQPTPKLQNKLLDNNQQILIQNSPTVSVIPSSSTITPNIIALTPTPTDIIIQNLPTLTLVFIQSTPTPSLLPTPTVTAFPSSTGYPSSPQGLNADIIFNLVNDHRSKLGLTVFQKDEKTCSIAQLRAPQVYNEIFVTNTMHHGLYARNLPYWITENIIAIDSEKNAVNWWLNDTIHRQVIEGNYLYSCVACSGNSCVQIFTSYISK